MDAAVKAWLDCAGRYALLRAEDELTLGRQVREWLDHPGGRDAAPPRVQRRGLRARERMVQCNLRLVWSVTRRSVGPSDSLIDLLQCGAIGLIRAVEKFDPTKGYKFSTYAFWWIKQALGRAKDHDNMIHIPTTLQQKIRGGKDVNPALKLAAECAYHPRSIDAPPRGGDSAPGESLADSIGGGTLELEPLTWAEALEAVLAVDPEGAQLLARRGEGSESTAALALEQGLTTPALTKRLQAARKRLRGLVEVEAVLAAG